MLKFQLRDEVIDVLTGFKGMIVAKSEYLLEDNVYRIQPVFKNMKILKQNGLLKVD
jgi:hypothetical protein